MKKLIVLFFTIIVTICFLACKTENLPNTKTNTIKKLFLNISDATNLYIGKSSSIFSHSARSITESNGASKERIFKITEDGYAEEVTYTYEIDIYDELGNKISTLTETATEIFTPTSIIKLNDEYLIVCFTSNNYLVNTRTGECYNYTNDIPYIHDSLSYYSGDSVMTDASNNIYFVSDSKILMLDITNPENTKLKTMTPSSEKIDYWTWGVDKNGNIAYEGKDISGNGVLRFKSKTEGFKNLPGNTNFSCTMIWQGLDGIMYYFNQSNPNSKIKKLNPEPYSAEDYKEEDSASTNMGACGFKALLRAKNKNRMILLADGSSYPEFYEVYNNETNLLKKIDSISVGLKKFKFGIASDDYYYLVGINNEDESTIVKIDPENYSYEELISGGTLDVYNLSISNNLLIFNALRMSDGAIVMGTINNEKKLTILDENLEEQVTVLEKIR